MTFDDFYNKIKENHKELFDFCMTTYIRIRMTDDPNYSLTDQLSKDTALIFVLMDILPDILSDLSLEDMYEYIDNNRHIYELAML